MPKIRHFQSGDEAAQVAVYNVAAAGLPKFKPATTLDVQRRTRARDFNPRSRLIAEIDGKVVGYGIVGGNGRISYPWVLPGEEHCRTALFDAMLAELKAQAIPKAFAAYREDWGEIGEFFSANGFPKAREVVNYYVPFQDMPTPSNLSSSAIAPLEPSEVDQVFALAPSVVRSASAGEFERHLFKNPYFPPESLFALRSRVDRRVLAVGILVSDLTYADPTVIDAQMPCFRLGAFGSEGMDSKRVNGLFSFLARDDRTLSGHGLELMGEACLRIAEGDTVSGMAAQVASDAGSLFAFYQRYFRRQGGFPIYERAV